MGWALKDVTKEGLTDLPLRYTPSLFSLGLIISVPKPLRHQDGNPLVHTAYLSLALSNTWTPHPTGFLPSTSSPQLASSFPSPPVQRWPAGSCLISTCVVPRCTPALTLASA